MVLRPDTWQTSQFCHRTGCVESSWQISQFCQGGGCVESGQAELGMVGFRDTKDRNAGIIYLTPFWHQRMNDVFDRFCAIDLETGMRWLDAIDPWFTHTGSGWFEFRDRFFGSGVVQRYNLGEVIAFGQGLMDKNPATNRRLHPDVEKTVIWPLHREVIQVDRSRPMLAA